MCCSIDSVSPINREPMSLSVIKEAMSVLDTISRLPTGAITFTNAVMSIFHVLSVILTTNGAEGWHTKVNEAMGEGLARAIRNATHVKRNWKGNRP